ncbi:uncharacterized protein LOC132143328 isoform X2 [Carassius carassius]|nr:uncharacterized protein LOC132143328 isoform X2 [Carassius carassius]XP_059409435.1 uncharacterized protein LOC132143328 isoform X2 [Carassius carassius]XP_059409436.1 uncharacterized protein LOC132143328 isoform X2 [Carassius carassius]
MDCSQSGNVDAKMETDGSMNIAKDGTDVDKEKHDEVVPVRKASWEPSVFSTIGKEIHYFAGHEISIWESLDSFGSVIWPAALALCRYLESNQVTVDLVDKAVLEIGAGTGLVSIVASLLGAWVTATDLPEVLGNLGSNLSRNTRGRCRYTPQVAALSWGYELDKTFPRSVYRYDYILAADVVYHHDFLAELLVTMRHFCQPGTTLIWANKTRFDSDLVFVENFKKTFNTILLADDGEVKIYSATMREESGLETSKETKGDARKGVDKDETVNKKTNEEMNEGKIKWTEQKFVEQVQEYEKKDVDFTEEQATGYADAENQEDGNLNNNGDDDYTNLENEPEDSEEDNDGCSEMDSAFLEQKSDGSTGGEYMRSWAPTIYYRPGKEVYHFLGREITIQESIDSYGATIWPAALALCRFLETPQGHQHIDLLDKSVLELGAGTGLLSTVVTLLGAKLTATDLPEILSNLRYNLNRNTRGRRRHEPVVTELHWGHKLDEFFPRSTHQYDYVLATDVVYHHDFLAELLFTMRHFCQPGTILVWANKVRYASDLGFIDNFLRYFEITLLEELDDVRIYVATCKTPEQGGDQVQEINKEEDENYDAGEHHTNETGNNAEEVELLECDDTQMPDETLVDKELQDFERPAEEEVVPANTEPPQRRSWAPTIYSSLGKEIYYFLGHEIKLQEAIDNYGGVVWPAALALCRFLDTPTGRQQINLLDKSMLELGAGTGLVSIVATLIGAKLMSTDLPEILGNLRCNLNRNTRWHWRHEPQVTALKWGYKLEETFPRCTHYYDYILAADVVYHHNCLAELLDTMLHFCQTGTTIILANKIRLPSDLVFIENFQKAFNTTLLTELDEVRIYSATMRI